MLSGTSASLATSGAQIASITELKTSVTTAITGAKLTFSATVEDAATDVPISSGKVDFKVQGPQTIDLGDVAVGTQGIASITTKDLSTIGNYRVKAEYKPSNPKISVSAATPVTLKVIPVPLDVPTTTTLTSEATSAETGQYVPLIATVKNAGTGDQVNAGLVEPITGNVEFIVDSPNPVVLGKAKLKKNGEAGLSTKKLKNVGPYQIEAEFLPSNKYFAASTSAPIPVAITPQTLNAPTAISLQATPNVIETGEPVVLTASVQNSNSSLADGVVEFTTVGRHPVELSTVPVSTFGEQISLTSNYLQNVGFHQVQAKYLPNTNRFAKSFSAPTTIAITPLTAVAFRVTPVVSHGKLNKPVSFKVTALNAHRQPLTDYTGTVVFSSPTDSSTTFPPAFYTNLHISASPPQTTGLAMFPVQSYTFTPADHGSYTFVGGVEFGKAGAEVLQVTQSNDPKVVGKATFAIE